MYQWIFHLPGRAIKTGLIEAETRKEAEQKLADYDYECLDTKFWDVGKAHIVSKRHKLMEDTDDK